VEKELTASWPTCRASALSVFIKMVEAALERPDDTVRDAVYPAAPGGVKTLSALARELKVAERAVAERAVAERVRYRLCGSYSHDCRRMLAPLLAAPEFRCNTRPTGRSRTQSACLPATRAPTATRSSTRPGRGAGRRGGAEGGAGRCRRRRRPGRAHPVRAVRADRAAGRAGPPRGLRPGRGPLEEPGRGPARRLRGQPRRTPRRPGQGPGRHGVHRRAPKSGWTTGQRRRSFEHVDVSLDPAVPEPAQDAPAPQRRARSPANRVTGVRRVYARRLDNCRVRCYRSEGRERCRLAWIA
jgi:hypothetical protein